MLMFNVMGCHVRRVKAKESKQSKPKGRRAKKAIVVSDMTSPQLILSTADA